MTGFEGDPGHEGGHQPMRALKGGQAAVNTQMPLESGNSAGGNTSGEIAGWVNSVIGSGSGGGAHLNPANGITTH